MFGIGFGELLIVLAVGILFLGPERSVRTAKSIGRVVGKLQNEWHKIKKDVSVDEDDDGSKR